jgi:hypothetical protein
VTEKTAAPKGEWNDGFVIPTVASAGSEKPFALKRLMIDGFPALASR